MFLNKGTACEPLPNPQNGHWTCDNRNLEIGTNCAAGCDSGYELVGNADRQCILGNDVHGIWTGASPSCRRKYLLEKKYQRCTFFLIIFINATKLYTHSMWGIQKKKNALLMFVSHRNTTGQRF